MCKKTIHQQYWVETASWRSAEEVARSFMLELVALQTWNWSRIVMCKTTMLSRRSMHQRYWVEAASSWICCNYLHELSHLVAIAADAINARRCTRAHVVTRAAVGFAVKDVDAIAGAAKETMFAFVMTASAVVAVVVHVHALFLAATQLGCTWCDWALMSFVVCVTFDR